MTFIIGPRTWVVRLVMVLVLAAPAVAEATPFGFALAEADISGEPGVTIGWGYSVSNDTDDWLELTGLGHEPLGGPTGVGGTFEHAVAQSLFLFPILAPHTTVAIAYASGSGLFELTWDGSAPVGFVNVGQFVVSGAFWDADPFDPAGANLLGFADDQIAPYSATVLAAGVPEPALLVLTGLGLAASIRRVRSRVFSAPGWFSR
jgi:hypothetical protein